MLDSWQQFYNFNHKMITENLFFYFLQFFTKYTMQKCLFFSIWFTAILLSFLLSDYQKCLAIKKHLQYFVILLGCSIYFSLSSFILLMFGWQLFCSCNCSLT